MHRHEISDFKVLGLIKTFAFHVEGISLYDPPEKIIPRWKGPPLEKSPEFLNYFQEQRNTIFAGNDGISVKKDEQNILQKSTESQSQENIATSSVVSDPNKKDNRNSKIVIEGSDGSVRAGKKSGKEFWQHTKKWSQGFLESYNAETDPEIKATMRDMGKGLDRWITEKEIQEAADLMNKMPEKNKKFMEKKLSKLKREMELFGPQAVVSKYREYAEDKKEDYLWWLDLPYVLVSYTCVSTFLLFCFSLIYIVSYFPDSLCFWSLLVLTHGIKSSRRSWVSNISSLSPTIRFLTIHLDF